MWKNYFIKANANISDILEGGTLSPGEIMLSKLSRKQKLRSIGISSILMFSLFVFGQTEIGSDTFYRALINAAERLEPENPEDNSNIFFDALAKTIFLVLFVLYLLLAYPTEIATAKISKIFTSLLKFDKSNILFITIFKIFFQQKKLIKI